jgi:hypothetical protein
MCCLSPLDDANVLPHALHAWVFDSDSLPLEFAVFIENVCFLTLKSDENSFTAYCFGKIRLLADYAVFTGFHVK